MTEKNSRRRGIKSVENNRKKTRKNDRLMIPLGVQEFQQDGGATSVRTL